MPCIPKKQRYIQELGKSYFGEKETKGLNFYKSSFLKNNDKQSLDKISENIQYEYNKNEDLRIKALKDVVEKGEDWSTSSWMDMYLDGGFYSNTVKLINPKVQGLADLNELFVFVKDTSDFAKIMGDELVSNYGPVLYHVSKDGDINHINKLEDEPNRYACRPTILDGKLYFLEGDGNNIAHTEEASDYRYEYIPSGSSIRSFDSDYTAKVTSYTLRYTDSIYEADHKEIFESFGINKNNGEILSPYEAYKIEYSKGDQPISKAQFENNEIQISKTNPYGDILFKKEQELDNKDNKNYRLLIARIERRD